MSLQTNMDPHEDELTRLRRRNAELESELSAYHRDELTRLRRRHAELELDLGAYHSRSQDPACLTVDDSKLTNLFNKIENKVDKDLLARCHGVLATEGMIKDTLLYNVRLCREIILSSVEEKRRCDNEHQRLSTELASALDRRSLSEAISETLGVALPSCDEPLSEAERAELADLFRNSGHVETVVARPSVEERYATVMAAIGEGEALRREGKDEKQDMDG